MSEERNITNLLQSTFGSESAVNIANKLRNQSAIANHPLNNALPNIIKIALDPENDKYTKMVNNPSMREFLGLIASATEQLSEQITKRDTLVRATLDKDKRKEEFEAGFVSVDVAELADVLSNIRHERIKALNYKASDIALHDVEDYKTYKDVMLEEQQNGIPASQRRTVDLPVASKELKQQLQKLHKLFNNDVDAPGAYQHTVDYLRTMIDVAGLMPDERSASSHGSKRISMNVDSDNVFGYLIKSNEAPMAYFLKLALENKDIPLPPAVLEVMEIGAQAALTRVGDLESSTYYDATVIERRFQDVIKDDLVQETIDTLNAQAPAAPESKKGYKKPLNAGIAQQLSDLYQQTGFVIDKEGVDRIFREQLKDHINRDSDIRSDLEMVSADKAVPVKWMKKTLLADIILANDQPEKHTMPNVTPFMEKSLMAGIKGLEQQFTSATIEETLSVPLGEIKEKVTYHRNQNSALANILTEYSGKSSLPGNVISLATLAADGQDPSEYMTRFTQTEIDLFKDAATKLVEAYNSEELIIKDPAKARSVSQRVKVNGMNAEQIAGFLYHDKPVSEQQEKISLLGKAIETGNYNTIPMEMFEELHDFVQNYREMVSDMGSAIRDYVSIGQHDLTKPFDERTVYLDNQERAVGHGYGGDYNAILGQFREDAGLNNELGGQGAFPIHHSVNNTAFEIGNIDLTNPEVYRAAENFFETASENYQTFNGATMKSLLQDFRLTTEELVDYMMPNADAEEKRTVLAQINPVARDMTHSTELPNDIAQDIAEFDQTFRQKIQNLSEEMQSTSEEVYQDTNRTANLKYAASRAIPDLNGEILEDVAGHVVRAKKEARDLSNPVVLARPEVYEKVDAYIQRKYANSEHSVSDNDKSPDTSLNAGATSEGKLDQYQREILF